MPIKSRWQTSIPAQSLPTFLFTSPDGPLDNKKPLIIDAARPSTHFLTSHSYRLWCKRFAAGLVKAGFKPGDRLLLFSANSIFFPVVMMGTVIAGGIFTGANPTYVARELAYQLEDSGATFCIASDESLETALDAIKLIGMSRDSLFVFDDGAATFEGKGRAAGDVKHWTSLVASVVEGERFRWADLTTPEELDRTIALNYSSGTTGKPKGVMITHKNYVSNVVQARYMRELSPDFEEARARAAFLCFLPMYHAYGQKYFCVMMPQTQVPAYIMRKYDFLKMLEYVQKFRITALTLVPPIAVALSKHPAVKDYDLSSIESVGSGAAPLGREVCSELEKIWPNCKINVKQGWGMTEITCTATTWDPLKTSTDSCVGELIPNSEAKIMADDGITELSSGQSGEIWYRGPQVTKGYWNKPEATRETLTSDGWLKTGDVARVDEGGNIYIVDRIKELIKVKGNQVAPAELEALLLDHPSIVDAAVIGIKVDLDEKPRAYVVIKEGRTVIAEEIQNFMNKRVARVKRLTGGIKFVETIPKNPSGKILRKILREQAQAETNLRAKL